MTQDPSGQKDDLNLYAYCHDNPVTGVDPQGLWTVELSFGGSALAGLIGGLGGTENIGIAFDSKGNIGLINDLYGSPLIWGFNLGLSGSVSYSRGDLPGTKDHDYWAIPLTQTRELQAWYSYLGATVAAPNGKSVFGPGTLGDIPPVAPAGPPTFSIGGGSPTKFGVSYGQDNNCGIGVNLPGIYDSLCNAVNNFMPEVNEGTQQMNDNGGVYPVPGWETGH